MTLLLALLLAQPPYPTSMTARQGMSLDGGHAWPVECVNCSGGGTSSAVSVLDAGVLNVNFPATQAVSGTFWQATQPVSGSVSVSNFPATQPVSGTVTANAGTGTMAVSLATAPTTPVTGTFWQSTQPVSGTVTANAGTGTLATSNTNLDVALSTRTKPSDQQHVIVDTVTPTVGVSGTVTANAGTGTMAVSLATAPTTPVTGTFWQATQPVSLASAPTTPITAAALPLPSGAATDSTLSGLLDGGVGLLSTIAANQTSGNARVQITFIAQPLNPFLPRCNPVRRTGCQP